MKHDELMELAEKIAANIEEQPKDGRERSITITVGGNNGGHISIGGTQVVVGSKESRREWTDLTDEELRQELQYWSAQWWSGWRGFWLNIPAILLILALVAIAFGLITGLLLTTSIPDIPYSPYSLIATMAAISGLAAWMMTIRRVEGLHMQRSRSHIDAVKAEIRRRRR